MSDISGVSARFCVVVRNSRLLDKASSVFFGSQELARRNRSRWPSVYLESFSNRGGVAWRVFSSRWVLNKASCCSSHSSNSVARSKMYLQVFSLSPDLRYWPLGKYR